MTKILRMTAFIVVLFLAAMACAFLPNSGTSDGNSSDPNVLYQDDFSDSNSGWEDIFRDETGISDYDQGGFRLQVLQTNFDYWANPGKSFSNSIIEVDARKIGGPDDNDFGVICRYVDNQNFYFFILASDGYYGIGKYTNGDQALIGTDNLGETDKVLSGGATNHIQADCVGSTLRLYVNGNLLQEVTDSDHASGDVGLIAGTFNSAGTDFLFDNFVVRKP